MIYNAPTKGEDGLYFVKVLNDDKRKSLVQLNKVKITDVSGEIIMHLGSDANIDKIDGVDTQNLEAALENCESWFGKKVSDGVIRGAYTSTINAGSMTCDRIEATKVFNTHQRSSILRLSSPKRIVMSFSNLLESGSPRRLSAQLGMSSR